MKKKLLHCLLALLFISISTYGQTSFAINPKVLSEWEARKYSMFIHWGIYSELGGVWQGKNISVGLSEQIQAHAGIYSDVYAAVAKRFNPEKWNADSIVTLAKNAGMRSIVFTSKHHDGFCMFHTKYTDFNVVDATPYKRDVLKELSDACGRQGIKFALYFSLIDWHFPQAMPISSHNSDAITPEHFEFNKKQIEELLTNYGAVSELWFDMGSHTLEQSIEMRNWVHKLQPDCMIGSRLGNGMGDFNIMGDNQEPDYIIGVPWQSPASFFDETWGYRSWQNRGDKTEKMHEKLTSLIKVVSRGGNYLLNIGPRGDGSVVEFEKDILLEIGAWLEKNKDAIYNTQADPFHVPFTWGAITSKPNKLYLHVLSVPSDKTITLAGLSGSIAGVQILGEKVKCKFSQNASGVSVFLPNSIKEFQVIEISFKNGYTVPPINIIPVTENIQLNQYNAFKYYSNSGIDYNSRFQSTIKEEWTLLPSKTQKAVPTLYYSDEEKNRTILLQLGKETVSVKLDSGQPIPLNNDMKTLTWSPIYLWGPTWSGIDGLPTGVNEIDVNKAWQNQNWTKTDWLNDRLYTLEGGRTTSAYFALQEIVSPTDQQIIIKIVSGDGVIATLNGKIIALNNNAMNKESIETVLVLDLKKGTNQLLVKLYNNFKKEIPFAIKREVPQQLYRQKLHSIQVEKGKYFPISWRLDNPLSIHETLNLPNLNLSFE